MIISILFAFSPKENCILPAATGNYIHGLLLNTIASIDNKLAEEIHADGRAKPFTVSPIFGEFEPAGRGNNKLSREKQYWARFTALSKELSALLVKALNENPNRGFAIAGNEMMVKDVFQDTSSHEWAGISSHERIYDKYIVKQEGISRKITLRFLTPTTFRTDKKNLVLPVPKTLLVSTLEKWNTFSGIPIDEKDFIGWVEECCVVTRHEIKTRMWDFEKYKYAGFVGEVEFSDLNREETAYRALFNMLCDYMFWSGAGSKTTMGFGMAKVSR